ncbi:MAG TPA: HAD family hydrolase [Solirubrobacteraceae bacterium]|nr:HAD family hydrolase [Solirubrobacteraceae bacterium]
MSRTRPTLLLFDIDGTLLIRAVDDHRDAIHAAITRVHGIREPQRAKVAAAGRTDPQIARDICLQLGLSATRFDEGLLDLKRVAAEEYARRHTQDLTGTVAPGVHALLEELAERDDVILSLVTGNLEAIARGKLQRAGIGHFFPRGHGGFASDSEDRTDLPGIARARAGGIPSEDAIVIGDTPLDILCARADGVRCIAVATGPYSVDQLRDADAVVSDATELGPLLRAPR